MTRTTQWLSRVRISSALLLGLGLAVSLASLYAQDVTTQLRRVYETSQPAIAYQRQRPNDGKTNFQWGAWTAPAIFAFHNQDANKLIPETTNSLFIFDQRLWGRWDFEDGKALYLRFRYLDFDYDTEPGVTTLPIYEQGFDLDVGYLDIPSDDWSFRFGRQYVVLGRGISFYNRIDAARVNWGDQKWYAFAFAGMTPRKTTDLDPFIGRSDREFAGVHAEYKTDADHRLFAYALVNEDKTQSTVANFVANQGLQYDTQYYAFGSEGRIVDDFFYYGELIWERGESYANGIAQRGPKMDVEADAQYLEASWRPDRRHHPTIQAAYFRGSGDADRGSVISSVGGNLVGTQDSAFIGLGRFDGGLALSPRLSNLVVYRLGATYDPLEIRPDYKTAQIGGFVSLYRKDEAAGAISNGFATVASDDVGIGYDFVASYRPQHDLAFAFQAGILDPGDAFPDPGRDLIRTIYASVIYNY